MHVDLKFAFLAEWDDELQEVHDEFEDFLINNPSAAVEPDWGADHLASGPSLLKRMRAALPYLKMKKLRDDFYKVDKSFQFVRIAILHFDQASDAVRGVINVLSCTQRSFCMPRAIIFQFPNDPDIQSGKPS